jgi:hypothetical protein
MKGQIERGNRMGCIWKAKGTGKGKRMGNGKGMRKKGEIKQLGKQDHM